MESIPKTLFVGQVFLERETLDSTNRFATDWIASKIRPEGAALLPPAGTAIMALSQPQGRGQYGTSWHTEPGAGLALSVIFYPDFLPAREVFRLNVALSLGVLDALKGTTSAAWSLKWPNDVYAGDRKVAGLLIENGIAKGHLSYAVLGIGLNVNQRDFPADLPNPASLFQLDGEARDLRELACRLCESLETRYEQLRLGAWLALKRQYLGALYGYGERRRFLAGDQEFEGVLCGVEDSGELAVESGGILRRYRFKEIQFLPDLA